MLWFAFNLLSLTYWKQQASEVVMTQTGCDLLSIYYLWHTENNSETFGYSCCQVVICFQSIIFDILKTTLPGRDNGSTGCDLLSIYYLWHTENNSDCVGSPYVTVVICFQSIIFDILKTTADLSTCPGHTLWFAFNLLSLTYWKQPGGNEELDAAVVICFQSIIFDILKTTWRNV